MANVKHTYTKSANDPISFKMMEPRTQLKNVDRILYAFSKQPGKAQNEHIGDCTGKIDLRKKSIDIAEH